MLRLRHIVPVVIVVLLIVVFVPSVVGKSSEDQPLTASSSAPSIATTSIKGTNESRRVPYVEPIFTLENMWQGYVDSAWTVVYAGEAINGYLAALRIYTMVPINSGGRTVNYIGEYYPPGMASPLRILSITDGVIELFSKSSHNGYEYRSTFNLRTLEYADVEVDRGPPPEWEESIYDPSPDSIHFRQVFGVENLWQGYFNGVRTRVYAGLKTAPGVLDPKTSAVRVYTYQVNEAGWLIFPGDFIGVYEAPQMPAPLRIVEVTDGIVYLISEADTGEISSINFNLYTNQFEEPLK